MTAIYVLLAIVALLGIWAVATYNGLVRARNRADEAWSGVDVQLKRRCDLVPNLVAAVQGYARHERSVLEAVAAARAAVLNAGDRDQREHSESGLSEQLTQLRAVAENYPDLKASANFLQLQRDLEQVENEIQAARNIFNGNVRYLNTLVQQFPSSVVARFGSFEPRKFFEVELAADRLTPAVALA